MGAEAEWRLQRIKWTVKSFFALLSEFASEPWGKWFDWLMLRACGVTAIWAICRIATLHEAEMERYEMDCVPVEDFLASQEQAGRYVPLATVTTYRLIDLDAAPEPECIGTGTMSWDVLADSCSLADLAPLLGAVGYALEEVTPSGGKTWQDCP